MSDLAVRHALRAFDRLEVGPTRVEPRRLATPYTVVRGGERVSAELVYKWDEDVFEPDADADRNLAGLIGAQLALNYGLFCGEIVFRDPLDAHDRRFLADMAENTAREIYAIKLLHPNPFLVGAAAQLEPRPLRRYLQASLLFDRELPTGGPQGGPWALDRLGHAVLSSGGKDSLLTHGLLGELGMESHPIFVAESGRHWHTALNAHRHFAEHVPHTARVWTTSDRVFSFMLRQLPIVRPDFQRLRSDEYPIRLWTVAVFLFGALPLLRKRGLGRLLIGDEFDTTVRKTYHGITHYDGLYDQSRFFDQAMSRYFHRKGWDVAQFSLLRPLSELLIEKVLVERYPELQAHQTSCHATHVEDGRVRPCGACEKCRRIVGMLVALGADPTRCGYTAEQVAECLRALAEAGVHQESAGAQHLTWLLSQAGRLPEGGGAAHAARPHPEIGRLRYDPVRSPVDWIPRDLRAPLTRLLLEHADGAVRRVGRVWVEFDPLDPDVLAAPYPFEAPPAEATSARRDDPIPPPAKSTQLWCELTWPEALRRLQQTDLALLPVGATEQHGPHLPLDTDTFSAEFLALAAAEACSEPRPLVLPAIPFGVSYHHEDFAGTIAIDGETLERLVYEIGMNVARHGITKLVIVNGHGGNIPALQLAAQRINRDARIFTTVDTGETSDADVEAICSTPNDVHAGEIETSMMLAQRPQLVDMALAERSVSRFPSPYLDFDGPRSVEWYVRTARLSRTGVLGDATVATADKGRRIWAVQIRHMVTLLEDLKGLSLDAIGGRRR